MDGHSLLRHAFVVFRRETNLLPIPIFTAHAQRSDAAKPMQIFDYQRLGSTAGRADRRRGPACAAASDNDIVFAQNRQFMLRRRHRRLRPLVRGKPRQLFADFRMERRIRRRATNGHRLGDGTAIFCVRGRATTHFAASGKRLPRLMAEACKHMRCFFQRLFTFKHNRLARIQLLFRKRQIPRLLFHGGV